MTQESGTRSVRLPDGGGGSVSGRVHEPRSGSADGLAPTLALTHGAGGNRDTPGLVALSRRLAAMGVRVLRFNLPAAEAGKRRPDRPAAAMRAIAAAAGEAASRFGGPLFLGGRSFGGRMASLLLADPESSARRLVAGAVLLAYPLKPPGRPEVPPERVEHLGRIEVRVLFVSGDRDPFAPPGLLDPVAARIGAELCWIAGGDHGFRAAKAVLAATGRSAGDLDEEIARAVRRFVLPG